ncbi:MAG: hypothetical protein ACXVIJ_09820 [Thermoanaerobaculia bacterium]
MPIIRSAFAVIVMSIAIVLPSRAALQKPQAPDRIVAAAVSTGHVRLSAGVDVSQLRIEVRAPGGALVYDSGWRSGNLLDWSMEDEFGHALAYGTYALIATSRDLSGAATSHAGTLHVEASEARIESDEVEVVSEPPSIVRLHHDGAAGQLITTRGDLMFRFGDFLARRDVEAMRLTPEGNLEVAGVIHAGKGIMFPDGTVQLTAMTPGLFRLPGGASAFQPSLAIAGNGTTNQLAKWIDDLGTLGDSAVTEVAGKVGIGTTAPGTLLHVFGPATSDVFAGLGPDPKNGPGMNYGYSGNTFGRGSGFFNVRPDASATAPNPSLRFMTVNIQRMVITNTGDVGIGTSAPAQKLDVNASVTPRCGPVRR